MHRKFCTSGTIAGPSLCLLLILCLTFAAVGGTSSQTAPAPTPPSKDFANGLRVTLEAIKELGVVDDPVKVKRLNDIAYRVAKRAVPDAPHYSFRIVKMEEPNAFALPGGFIFVTTGMLDLGLNDDELAALLGHEITHVRNEHFRRMGKRQTLMNLLYQALVVGIALGIRDGGNTYNPATGAYTRSSKSEILQGTAAFGLVFQELLLRGFSRDLELEADEGGMRAAAGAGYSSKGTGQLFEKMRQRTFEAPGYGYWRTHPYLEDRIAAARTLEAGVESSKNPSDANDYRKQTQNTFLDYVPSQKEDDASKELRRMALQAFPHGKAAFDLRWRFIQDAEAQEMRQEPFYRDYGKLIQIYKKNIDEIRDDAEAKDFLAKLEGNLQTLEKEKETRRPLYEEVLNKESFDTEMLKRYISNYPDSPRLPEVRFRLAENLRILQKYPQSVELHLENAKSETDWKTKSRNSLKNLVKKLEDLSTCYKIKTTSEDLELQKLAETRMGVIAGSFQSMKNGYEFRRTYPSSAYEQPVLAQMTKLASETLNQGRLYQAIGEYQKALDQYNQILRYCSDLPIADQVKDNIVTFQELTSNKG